MTEFIKPLSLKLICMSAYCERHAVRPFELICRNTFDHQRELELQLDPGILRNSESPCKLLLILIINTIL